MERKEAIRGAYRLTGGNNFYDGMTIYTDIALKAYLEQAGFCQIQSHKNKKGWLCITAQK